MASGAFLFIAAVNTSAHAQTQPAASAAAAGTIEELVVTAEKRSQNLQEVPIAISAYTSEKRDLLGINSVQDMTNFTPGLQYSSQGDRISLRGVGRLTNVQAADPGVASYSDGVYTSSTVEAGKTPIFVDRVEVLRGPQGTLYGRNSIGGAINVISKRPTEDFYAEVRATVANYGRTLLEGAVSGPLTEGLQFRLAGNWEKQRDGYFTNVVPGMPSQGNVIDQYYVEGQLQGKFGDRLEGWVKASIAGWNNGAGGPGGQTSYTPGPYNPLETLPSALYINPNFACSGVATNVVNASPTGCVNPASSDRRKFASTIAQTVSLDETYVLATQWTYHFDAFDLKYIGGYDTYHYTLVSPLDGGAVQSFQIPLSATATCNFVPGCTAATIRPGGSSSTYQENKHWDSHELNLSSSGSGSLQWLVGAYYYHEAYQQPVFTTLAAQTGLNGLVQPAVPALTPLGVASVFQNRSYDDRPQLEDTSYAGFGQIDWKFAQDWKTTLGIRYSHDKKDGSESVRLICYQVAACGTVPETLGTLSPPVDVTAATVYGPLQSLLLGGAPVAPPKGVVNNGKPGGVTFTPDGFATRNYDASFDAWTGTAGLQWDPDRDTMAYARYSRGYKAGGFNVGITTTLGSSPYTGPEHSDAFEVGLKKDLFNHTLQTNLAVFYYNYQDLQAPLTIVNTQGGLAQSQGVFLNVPKAISQGVELETIWQPIDHLQVGFNYSYNDAHIKQLTGIIDPNDPTGVAAGAKPIGALSTCAANPTAVCDIYSGNIVRAQNLAGNALPNSARNKVALNVTYTVELDKGSLSPSLSYIWRDKQYGTIFDRSYYQAPSWDQVDARLTWKDKDNKYSIIGYVKNVFDSVGYESGSTATRYSGLATGGIPMVLTGLGDHGVSPTYYLTPPRTYGVELQYRF
jgi:iron complex outermembrane receptor protein